MIRASISLDSENAGEIGPSTCALRVASLRARVRRTVRGKSRHVRSDGNPAPPPLDRGLMRNFT